MFWILFGWSWDVWNIPLVTKPPWSSCRERLAGAKRKKPMTSHPKSDQRIQQDGKLMCLLPSLRRKIAFTLQTSCLSIRQYSNIRATILAPHQEFIISPTHRKNMVWFYYLVFGRPICTISVRKLYILIEHQELSNSFHLSIFLVPCGIFLHIYDTLPNALVFIYIVYTMVN